MAVVNAQAGADAAAAQTAEAAIRVQQEDAAIAATRLRRTRALRVRRLKVAPLPPSADDSQNHAGKHTTAFSSLRRACLDWGRDILNEMPHQLLLATQFWLLEPCCLRRTAFLPC